MAVNQVSLFFYRPRWKQHCTPSPGTRTDEGKPVQVVNAVPVDDDDSSPVRTDAVKKWSVQRGFAPVDWGRGCVFQCGQVRSIFGTEKALEIRIGDVEGEVSDLYIRFTLPRETAAPLAEWAEFVMDLCRQFNLRLGDAGASPCNQSEFIAAVRSCRNLQLLCKTEME